MLNKLDRYFKTHWFISIKIYTLMFLFFTVQHIVLVKTHQVGGYEDKGIIYDIYFGFILSYLAMVLTLLRPFAYTGIIFYGEEPLKPLGYLFGTLVILLAMSGVIYLIFKLFKEKINLWKEKIRNVFFIAFDILISVIFITILVLPFFQELDYF